MWRDKSPRSARWLDFVFRKYYVYYTVQFLKIVVKYCTLKYIHNLNPNNLNSNLSNDIIAVFVIGMSRGDQRVHSLCFGGHFTTET